MHILPDIADLYDKKRKHKQVCKMNWLTCLVMKPVVCIAIKTANFLLHVPLTCLWMVYRYLSWYLAKRYICFYWILIPVWFNFDKIFSNLFLVANIIKMQHFLLKPTFKQIFITMSSRKKNQKWVHHFIRTIKISTSLLWLLF